LRFVVAPLRGEGFSFWDVSENVEAQPGVCYTEGVASLLRVVGVRRKESQVNTAVKAIIGIFLILLLVGIAVTAAQFLVGAVVVTGIILLALAGLSKSQEQRLKVPSGFAHHRNEKAAQKALKRLEKTVGVDNKNPPSPSK
jgi:hypothetical protein